MVKRYKKYWTAGMGGERPVFISEEQIENYLKKFPRDIKVLVKEFEISCCDGHTFRQIMGYDELDH